MTASLANGNVVDVRGGAFLEKRQQLMLGLVKTAHTGVRFCPDDQIESRQTQSNCGRVDNRQPAPIDECAKDSSIDEIRKDGIDPFLIKIAELRAVISPEAIADSRGLPPITSSPIATSVKTNRATSCPMSRRMTVGSAASPQITQ